MKKNALIFCQWTVLVISMLFHSSCIYNKVPDKIWDISKETDYITITNHYKSLKLDNGEIVCGELIDGITEVVTEIGARNDTVYFDKDSRILLFKNTDFKQRSFYNSQGQL